jgi:hypothetical protein
MPGSSRANFGSDLARVRKNKFGKIKIKYYEK